jgi:antitoxin HicB
MTDMVATARPTLDEVLDRQYPFNVLADPDGGFVIVFPDLPGCVTQAETVDEVPEMAEEARRLWLETAYEDGDDIPLPSYPGQYSGKFNVRLPHSLHRELVEEAEREGVSLNTYIATLLARRDALIRIERQIARLQGQLDRMEATADRQVKGVPNGVRSPYEADVMLTGYAAAA